jgi:hypothetical protein
VSGLSTKVRSWKELSGYTPKSVFNFGWFHQLTEVPQFFVEQQNVEQQNVE